MKIKKGLILAAGLGTRMKPLTNKTPKPLINIGKKNLLERGINLLINHGVEEIVINVHHLGDQIKKFILNKNYKIKVYISDEKKKLLDTGGGVLNGIKYFDNDAFIVLNPDTLWSKNYNTELKSLEDSYLKHNKPCILVVEKKLSFDQSFVGDFNIDSNGFVDRQSKNEFIFTGLQILDPSVFNFVKKKVFSMNIVWDNLIDSNNLIGVKSKQIFYHLNTETMYNKINNLNIID